MIRVLVVDDDALVRSGLRLMLGGAPDVEVVGEAADGGEVAAAVADHDPDVVLMDVRMPGVDGVAATRALTARGPRPAVVVLTTFGTDHTVLAAMRAGAAGYLLKHTPPAEIVAGVRRAAAGEPVLSPDVARTLMALAARQGESRGSRAARQLAGLSPRERDIAAAVAQGLTNAEIGARLHLSASSVKATLSAVLTKLDLTNRTQLAILTHEAGEHGGES